MRSRWTGWFRLVVVLVGIGLGLDLLARLVAEILWFQEVGYSAVLRTRLITQGLVGAIAFAISAIFLLGNLALARRWQYPPEVSQQSPNASASLSLKSLLPLTLGLAGILSGLLVYYGQILGQDWGFAGSHESLITQRLGWLGFLHFLQQGWPLGLIGLLGVGLLIFPVGVWISAGLLSLGLSAGAIQRWMQVLPFFQPVPFRQTEPIFGQDIAAYVFGLPVWEWLSNGITVLSLAGFVSVALVYLRSGNSLSEGEFLGFSRRQRQHLQILAAQGMLAIALGRWIGRYELLYSIRGVVYGASFTDTHVLLPVHTGLSGLAGAIAVFLLWQAFRSPDPIAASSMAAPPPPQKWQTLALLEKQPLPTSRAKFHWSQRPILTGLLVPLGVYGSLMVLGWVGLPWAVQRLVVQPNELSREAPYLQRNIDLTRQAFDLTAIDVETFNPQNNLDLETVRANNLTIRNIRLWDTRPLLQTNRQLQQIRLYYKFPDADIDRYSLSEPLTDNSNPNTPLERQQVLIAARELDYTGVPPEAQTWVNQHLTYTHGFGFTVSPVNRVGPGGLPDYFIKDIGPVASSDRIEASIPIGRPRIYYGELTDNYVMAQTKVRELDFPSGSDNVYNVYDGYGGVSIGTWWRRGLMAVYLRDWRMLFAQNFTPETRLLFRRNIRQRVQAIAPFLRYDHDPYLVSANTPLKTIEGQPIQTTQNYLYWILDAYTTSDRYPYSDPGENPFNYIRNSIKVVIDAYHGSVNFYVADPSDPIINSWNKIFPGMFQPLEFMPPELHRHIRYPQDFYQVQAQALMTYHMTDTQVFYNREDQWRAPIEIYGNKPQLVEPYYLIMKLPNEDTEEFILLFPFTPAQRNNLIAWLAARSDGDRYGKMLLYRFPKQELVYGPEQIEARINQDPIISEQISLWNRQGSRAIQGNLLVIPIEQSLLYVEPLYLEAEQNSLPTFVRVIVAYENRIVMAETLDQALNAIFQQAPPTTPAIVRPVDEPNATAPE